ncbi:Non-ribosomal peptide synthetase-like protein, partial [Corchorus capsularis]
MATPPMEPTTMAIRTRSATEKKMGKKKTMTSPRNRRWRSPWRKKGWTRRQGLPSRVWSDSAPR